MIAPTAENAMRPAAPATPPSEQASVATNTTSASDDANPIVMSGLVLPVA